MPIAKSIEIIDVEEINSTTLQFSFNVKWTMDDKTAVIDHILLILTANIVEVVLGADVYCLRIKYGVYEFLLNFEEYSHACWLECVTDQDRKGLEEVKKLLS